jgi:hypothetical protein
MGDENHQSLSPVPQGWEKVADRPDEGLFRWQDSWRGALIRPLGTFSQCFATGEGESLGTALRNHGRLAGDGLWEMKTTSPGTALRNHGRLAEDGLWEMKTTGPFFRPAGMGEGGRQAG